MPPSTNQRELKWDPPTVSRAATIPESEWEEYRLLITSLHEEGYTLDRIISIVHQRCVQEGLHFEPTRKQYISRLKKWGLRRYGVPGSITEGSSTDGSTTLVGLSEPQGNTSQPVTIAEDEAVDEVSKIDNNPPDPTEMPVASRKRSDCAKLGCLWCEPTSPSNTSKTVEGNHNALNQPELSDSERRWKLDLADFYYAAKSMSDAWEIYREVLWRSQKCSYQTRLFIAAKLLESSDTYTQFMSARARFEDLLLLCEDDPSNAGVTTWLMHTFLLALRLTPPFCRASQYAQRVKRLCAHEVSKSASWQSLQINHSPSEIDEIFKVAETPAHRPSALGQPGLSAYLTASLPDDELRILIRWCCKQVESGDYTMMLKSSCDKLWTEAPRGVAWRKVEETALFCFIWQRYRCASDVQSQRAWLQETPALKHPTVRLIEDLEQRVQIPAPMIFSTLLSMRTGDLLAGMIITRRNIEPEHVAERAFLNLAELIDDGRRNIYPHHDLTSLFFACYENSIQYSGAGKWQKTERSSSLQNFVQHVALVQLPSNTSNSSLGRHVSPKETYAQRRVPSLGTEGIGCEENSVDQKLLPALNRSAIPRTESQPIARILKHSPDERPRSSTSVEMGATPRSSFTSSKASLRSLQRLSRAAKVMLKRNGNGASQLPSEVMDRDSHSSWSLHRLTGISYLSTSTQVSANQRSDQDVIMDEPTVWI